ncbi:MAG TPA: SymE family type I addiction module toxin [Thermoanaerobaculia bacterium]|nr:SymE family type I addiction module toxin [Thermoanaerobaculia bacterium]
MRGRASHSTSPDLSAPQPEQLQLPQPDEWRERKLARAATARAKGHRFGTICCRMRGYRNLVPDLRISGHWLQRAGFDRGQHYEIEVRAGRLTIRAV